MKSLLLTTLCILCFGFVQSQDTRSEVISVTATNPDGLYSVNDIITIQVIFDNAVEITGDGVPKLILDIGANGRTINYTSGSGTNTLNFTYRVQRGDQTTDLEYNGQGSLITISAGGRIQTVGGGFASSLLPEPGSENSLSANKDISIDGVALIVTINDVPENVNGPFTAAFAFEEETNDFTIEDITVQNGTLSDFTTIDAQNYTVLVTPIEEGDVILDIMENVATDTAGNGNRLATTAIANFNRRPDVQISTTVETPVETVPVPIVVTFTERVGEFTEEDVVITNGMLANFDGEGEAYTFEVTPTEPGEVTITIAEGAAQDFLGNPSTAAEPFSFVFRTPTTLSSETFENIELTFAPNPTTGAILISSPVEEVQVYSLSGRQLITTSSSTVQLDNLAAGVYVLQAKSGNQTLTKRVVKL